MYHSSVAAGPFSSVAAISNYSITSFTYTSGSSGYFYVLTKFSNGSSSSAPSDTLKTIFLNIITSVSAPDLKLLYNDLHSPKLAGTSPTFTITKEYPAGTWKTLGVTRDAKYADTLSICSASINYQVSIADQSGCVSVSNLQGGIYKDNKSPDQPHIDSISVLPDGKIILAWKIPRDKDILKYEIQQKIAGGGNAAIDTVSGRNNTSYIFSPGSAKDTIVGIFVKALDSCNTGGSSVDYSPSSIFVETRYNSCAFTTELNWNEYSVRPEEILEYRVYYSAGGGEYQQIDAVTQTSYTHTGVVAGKNVSYFVRMITKDLKTTSSSNRVTFFTDQVDAASYVYIRSATVNEINSIMVFMNIDTTSSSEGIDLYRSENGKDYVHAGYIKFTGSADYLITDTAVSADTKSYYYKAIVRDSCGNPRTVSRISRTTLLEAKDDESNIFVKHLTWNHYEGFDGDISGYNIFRIVNDVRDTSPAATTGPQVNFYTDNLEAEAPNGSKIEYMVQAVEGITNPRGYLEISNSNRVTMYLEGRIFVPTAFAPAGINTTWRPVTHFIDKYDYSVTVFNRWGAEVFHADNDHDAWDGKNSAPGIYVYLIRYRNSRGEYRDLTGYVTLVR